MLHVLLLTLPTFLVGLTWKDAWDRLTGSIGGIGDFFDNITNRLTGLVLSGVGAAGAFLNNVGDAIWGHIIYALGGLANITYDALSAVGAGVGAALMAIGNLAADAAGSLRDHAVYALGGVVNVISDAAGSLRDHAIYALGGVVNVISDAAGSLRDHAVYALGGLANIFHDSIGSLADKLWDRLGDLLGGVQDAAGKVEALPEAALHIALDNKDEILKAYLLGFPDDVLLALPYLFEKFGTQVVAALRIDGKDIQTFAGDTFDSILGLMVGTGHIEPEDAPGLIARSLGVATAAGIAAQAPGLGQGLIPTENPAATNYVAGFLGKFSAWEPLINAGLGTAVVLALRRPMEYHLNKQSRTNEPQPRDLNILYSRNLVSPDTYEETILRHGYDYSWHDPIAESAFRPLNKFELSMIADAVNLPENQLNYFLQAGGYHPRSIPLLIQGLQARALKTANSAWLTQARDAYKDGFIDLPAFRAVMDALGIDPTEQDLWVMSAQAAYSNAVKTELMSAYRSAAAKDALSDDELRAACAQLGLTSDKTEIEVVRAQAARLKKPVDATAAADKATVNKARATMTQAYSLQFRKGAIDEQTFLAALTFIGVPDVQATAVVALAKAQSLEVPKAAPIDTPAMAAARTVKDLQDAYVLQYQHDLIDAQTLQSALEGTGMAPYEASAIVLREQAKKTPSPVVANKLTEERVTMQTQDALASAYVNQYQQGFIDADTLESDLVGIGLDPKVAHARRLLEESRAYGLATKSRESTEAQAAAQLQKAGQDVAVEAYRKGVITADQLEVQLVSIGLSPELAGSIRDLEQLRALPAPTVAPTAAELQAQRELQRVEQAAAVEAFRKGLLSADRLEVRLIAIGLSPDLAAATRDLEEVRATPGPPATPTPAEVQAQRQLLRVNQATAQEAFRKGTITADELETDLVSIGLSTALAASIRQYEELHALPKPPAAAAAP